MALLAKAKLYRQDWGTALTLCETIINSGNYALLSDFSTNFKVAGENGKESLFEIQASLGANGVPDNGHEYGVEQGVRGSGDWDLGWGWNTPTPELVASFETGDARKNATVLFSGQNDGYGKTVPAYPSVVPRAFWNKKVYPEPSMQAYTGRRQNSWLNHVIIRYADVILMAAEAANEIGGPANLAKATDYVNRIRNRAGLGNTTACLLYTSDAADD